MASYASVQDGEWDDGSTWGATASASMELSFDELPFIDDTGRHTITNNNVTATTTNAKWVSAGRFTAASSAYLNTSTGTDFDWDDNAWTVHWWMYTHTVPSDAGIWSNGLTNALTTGINCCFMSGGSSALRMYLGGTGYIIQTVDGFSTGPNHVAVVNDGSYIRVYKNGTEVNYTVGPHDSSGLNIVTPTTDFVIGRFYSNLAGFYMDTTIDEFVVAHGTALWTSDFTPPTAPGLGVTQYPNTDGDTATITDTVTYSISADVELGQIDINSGGTLSFNPSADTYMEIENNTFIYVNDAGLLTMGTSATPIHKDYTAELTFNCSTDNAGGVFTNNTGSMYACGDLDYFGADKETFLAYDCTGSTSITATEDMSSKWNIGDDILLSERALYTNWTLQGALTTITGFDGNIIHCADAISSAIVSGGIIAHLTRNVQIYKKGYVKAWYNINATGRPYIEFDEVTSTKWFSAVEFGGLSRLQNLYMNMPNFPSPDGLIEWCTFRNGSIALYYNYGARVDNCIFHSLNQTIHTGGNNYFSNIIFLACNYGIYASMVNSYAENIYGSNCGTIVQYPRSCKIVGLRSYGCYSDLGAGTNVTIIDSYLCGLNAGCPGSENMDFYNCSFGIDIDGKVITNNYNMQFSVGDYRYYNCKVEPSLSGKYRANNAAYARTYHRWENYNQVEGDHRLYSNFGDAFKIDADGSGDNPTQRGSGNSTIFEVQTESLCDKIYDYQYVAVIDQQIYVQADLQRTIRYYIQTDYTGGLTSDAIYLDAYYDTTQVISTDSVAIRSNQSDWSQYLEIIVNPTQDGWLRIKLIVNDYESGKYIWIDPKPEVV